MEHIHLPHNHGQNIGQVLAHMPDEPHIQTAAALFHILGDGNRLRIFWVLCHCEECVTNLSAAVSMSSPAVSHHLRILRQTGLITSRRKGKEVYYRISDSQNAELLHHFIDTIFEVSCPGQGCAEEG